MRAEPAALAAGRGAGIGAGSGWVRGEWRVSIRSAPRRRRGARAHGSPRVLAVSDSPACARIEQKAYPPNAPVSRASGRGGPEEGSIETSDDGFSYYFLREGFGGSGAVKPGTTRNRAVFGYDR
jgi:hypothetical protein